MDEEQATMQRITRQLSRADRFDNYREIVAKFASVAACGHPIARGDRIGYNRTHGCRCAACWSHWVAENASAAQDEAFLACGNGENY